MDETNPAYENFLNNMSRLGRTPRETTRRVSASKFLGRDNLETRIKLNERKITILKNIIQTQRMTTDIMLASLASPLDNVEKSIIDIKMTMFSILETLKAQDKFEYEKFLDMQRRSENVRRRQRESRLESVSGRGLKILNSGVQKALAPVTSIFSSILNGFFNLISGKILMGLADFLLNPAVSSVIVGLLSFVTQFFPLITGVFGLAVGGLALLLGRLGVLGPLLRLAASFVLGGPVAGFLGTKFLGPTKVARFGGTRAAGPLKSFFKLRDNPALRKRVRNPKKYK